MTTQQLLRHIPSGELHYAIAEHDGSITHISEPIYYGNVYVDGILRPDWPDVDTTVDMAPEDCAWANAQEWTLVAQAELT